MKATEQNKPPRRRGRQEKKEGIEKNENEAEDGIIADKRGFAFLFLLSLGDLSVLAVYFVRKSKVFCAVVLDNERLAL